MRLLRTLDEAARAHRDVALKTAALFDPTESRWPVNVLVGDAVAMGDELQQTLRAVRRAADQHDRAMDLISSMILGFMIAGALVCAWDLVGLLLDQTRPD